MTFTQHINDITESFNEYDLEKIINDGEFKPTSKTRMIIKTDIDRLKAMSLISDKYPDFKRDSSIKGSSIGGLKNNKLTILIKPKTKVKGGGGRAFENEFCQEFAKWSEDTSLPNIYSHLFESICSENNITPEDLTRFETKPMGGFNQKRTLKDILSKNITNIGQIVTDVDLKTPDEIINLSLKIGPSFYMYNGGFTKILKSDIERRTILSEIGADYKQFEKDFEINSSTNFEPTPKNGNEFFTNFVKSCVGFGYTMVHENGEKSTVKLITKEENEKIKVSVGGIRYRSKETESGKGSKYFAVDLDIIMFGKKFKSQFQLRNNAGKITPNVIYLLIGKESELSKEEKDRIDESNRRIIEEQEFLNEGGNAVGTVKKTKENTKAQKIQIAKIGRQEFMKKSLELFHKINQLFEKKFKEKLWKNEDHLTSGFMFNGSTSFIMDPAISDEDIIKVKPSAGDFDIAIPAELGENLWDLLDELEDEEVIPGVTYKGSNKPTKSSIGDQINCVFMMDFPGDIRAYAQVDFELLEFEDDTPTEWAKFSHSSSFEDANIQVKALFHKYIIRALASSVSVRNDIVIATPASTKEKYKLKKVAENDIPRMLKFSVTRGIRQAYEPLGITDPETGKEVYREMKTSESNFVTIVADIYGLVFGDVEKNPQDVKLFNSFKGICELIKKRVPKQNWNSIIERTEQLLWDEKMGQELEVGDPKTDYEVKIAGYNYLLKELGKKMTPKTQKMIDEYYAGYGKRKSFVSEALTFSEMIRNIKKQKLNEMAIIGDKQEYSSSSRKSDWEIMKNTSAIKLIKKNINSAHMSLYSTISEGIFFLSNERMEYLGCLEVETSNKIAKIRYSHSGIKSGFYSIVFLALLTFTEIEEILSDIQISQNAFNAYNKLNTKHSIFTIASKMQSNEYEEFNKQNVSKKGSRVSIRTLYDGTDKQGLQESFKRFEKSQSEFELKIKILKESENPNTEWIVQTQNNIYVEESRFLYGDTTNYKEWVKNV